VSVVFFDLNHDADGHGFVGEVHTDDFVEIGAGKRNFLKCGFASHDGTNPDQCKLFNQVVTDQDVVFIAADA
jgi:hypothetical protein